MSEEPENEIKGYLVGYGKPPVEHRFKKGLSGNPHGRPKSKKPAKEPLRSSDRPHQDMILDEAYRPVMVREGDQIIELPAIQAVLRAMGVSAMKGNRFAQKMLTELVSKVENEHHRIQYENMEAFTTYKQKWNEEIERCARLGLPEPTPLPHPDDVIIDYRKGTLQFAGPITKEEKVRWDRFIGRRDEAEEEIAYCERMAKEDPEYAKQYLEDAEFERRIFDLINEKLPERYKKKLQMRPPDNDDEKEEAA